MVKFIQFIYTKKCILSQILLHIVLYNFTKIMNVYKNLSKKI